MRMNIKSKTAALLALAMLTVTAASCGSGADTGTESANTSVDEQNTVTQADESEQTSGNPDDIDLEGFTLDLLSSDDIMFPTEDTGDIVDSAIYKRNTDVSEKLNVSFNVTNVPIADIKSTVQNSILSGSTDYDLISGMMYRLSPFVAEGMFADLNTLAMANYDAPWWASDFMKESSAGGNKLYMAAGDISIETIKQQSCIYFHKDLYSDYYGDPDNLYNTVADMNWVLDEFNDLVKGVYKDLNGDSARDIDDLYGITPNAVNNCDHLAYDAGFRSTLRDSDDKPYLVIESEKNVKIVEKIYQLLHNNPGTLLLGVDNSYSANKETPRKFAENTLMFALGWFSTSDTLRHMDSDYGVIPFPMYDESQEKYLAMVHDSAYLYFVPITLDAETADNVSYIMEEMAFLGWRDVTPAYYEVALKVKYIRDSDDTALKIVDMIHSGAIADFAYIYNYALENAGLIIRTLMKEKTADITPHYAANGVMYETKFAELLKVFTEIE